MSKLPKNLPFNELQLDSIQNTADMKRWLKTFISDFRKLYEVIYNEIENDGRKHRTVSADPTGTATYGLLGEIVFFNNKFYGKTVATGNDTDWSLLN
ncbi:MAG: hypothetical protein WC356_03575 [Candidatus Micrarchaeia archaeon]|jgi:hypothetical protein